MLVMLWHESPKHIACFTSMAAPFLATSVTVVQQDDLSRHCISDDIGVSLPNRI